MTAQVEPTPVEETVSSHPSTGSLWRGDTGTLSEGSRRALLEVLKGPYLSGSQQPKIWASLVADETSVRSRLHDLFLELVIDRTDEFAFVRKIETQEIDAPSALRSERLAFIDTTMLLVLRQLLLAGQGERRVIIDKDEVFERLDIYRGDSDESTFARNLNAAWGRMQNKLRILHPAGDDRYEISPVVKFLVDEDEVAALTAEFQRLGSTSESAASAPATITDRSPA
ncbi:DUF4194 domain-containing protein [Pseudoclavibacter helvolus]|uniref:DUF4194 domain-containing protein n=1 Tax=Pseudoclavibacter helvolus TaxID=255205 RepID=UPI001609FAFD|nr:DUF4194 domain-containing protein [Pseudoclavibacter helvolus]